MVTKQEEDSRVHLQHRSGPFKAQKLQEKKTQEARLGRISWGPKESLQTHLCEGIWCPKQACHCENWLEATCVGSKFKMKMKLRFRASHEHANSGRGCTSDLMRMLLVLRWRHADSVPGSGHGRTACERARGVVNYEVSCDWRFQPPKTLLEQGDVN